jgi:ABC-type transport system involved in multi-copper enzyme maturation permease subunit
MSVILAIVRFELRQRLRRISTWVYVALFFFIALLCILAAGGAIEGATVSFGTGGKVYIDAPTAIQGIATLIGLFGTSFVGAIAGQATYQDIDSGSAPLFFSLPISKSQYLVGRFIGAFLVCVLIYAAIGLGIAFGLALPILEPSRVGAHPHLIAFVQPYLVGLLPNLFVTAALFFSLAALSRRMLPVYGGTVVLLLGYFIALNLANDVENKTLTSILDPFGLVATDRITEYWTASEQNSRVVPLQGILLANRALWVGIAAALLAFTFLRFTFRERGTKRAREKDTEPSALLTQAAVPLKPPTLDFSGRAWGRVYRSLVWLQWRETVKSVIFLVLVLAGLLFMGSTAPAVGRLYGTPTWPVTYNVLEILGGAFSVFMLAIITYYSGELVWRERDARLSQMYDALPVPSALVFAAKWTALVLAEVLLLGVVIVGGVFLQTVKGYHHYELGLYVKWLFGIRLPNFAILTLIAMFVHTVVNNKYVGHFTMVGYYALGIFLPKLGFEHPMYWPNSQPDWTYSDMNGFGHWVAPIVWFKLYWAAFAVILAVATNLLWVRGTERTWDFRLKLFDERFGKTPRLVAAGAFAVFVALGVFIFWNLDIRHKFRTKFAVDDLNARYEKKYKAAWDGANQPKVTKASVAVDVFPEERRLRVQGTFDIENQSLARIDHLFVNLPETARVDRLDIDRGMDVADVQKALGVRLYKLGRPLGAKERAKLTFDLTYENVGFEDGPGDHRVVENGTFVHSGYMPVLGYQRTEELSDDDKRKKHKLPERARMRDLDDPKGFQENYVSRDGHWIKFDATVSTSSDQTAIAPGYLVKQWNEGGRAFFRYEMDAPILNFYSFLSARYLVKRDVYAADPAKPVAIEIYYHPGHDYDVDRMIRAIKLSLEYFNQAFTPYQHRQVRIIEFPRYETFAQSFPNTIPYSEAIGFIALVDEKKEDEIDYPLYITAHEVAHQWWAHQIIGADVQGSTMLSETFAQYSALMVMKHTFGERAMRKFLRYELDRYLQGRAAEHKKEVPLLRVENQPYIHYSKGSLVMYALQDAIGEETVNRVLHRLLERTAFKGPPYPNTRVFMEELRREAPKSAEPLIHDLFEVITLHDLRATAVTGKTLPDGRFEITVKATAKKLYADEVGTETEAPLDEELSFGALDDNGNLLGMEKHRVNAFENTVTFVVDKKPAKAGIDPQHLRIDRRPEDNVMAVTW